MTLLSYNGLTYLTDIECGVGGFIELIFTINKTGSNNVNKTRHNIGVTECSRNEDYDNFGESMIVEVDH